MNSQSSVADFAYIELRQVISPRIHAIAKHYIPLLFTSDNITPQINDAIECHQMFACTQKVDPLFLFGMRVNRSGSLTSHYPGRHGRARRVALCSDQQQCR